VQGFLLSHPVAWQDLPAAGTEACETVRSLLAEARLRAG
jgi:hypothetical protein